MRHAHRAWRVIFFAPDPTFTISWLWLLVSSGQLVSRSTAEFSLSRFIQLRQILDEQDSLGRCCASYSVNQCLWYFRPKRTFCALVQAADVVRQECHMRQTFPTRVKAVHFSRLKNRLKVLKLHWNSSLSLVYLRL